MSYLNYQPLSRFGRFPGLFDRVGRYGIDNGDNDTVSDWVVPVDIIEHDDHFALRADLPGISGDQIELQLDDSVLTLSGDRRIEIDEETTNYRHKERAEGRFSRRFRLPNTVDPASITARFDAGVLEIRIDKQADVQPRRISIEAA